MHNRAKRRLCTVLVSLALASGCTRASPFDEEVASVSSALSVELGPASSVRIHRQGDTTSGEWRYESADVLPSIRSSILSRSPNEYTLLHQEGNGLVFTKSGHGDLFQLSIVLKPADSNDGTTVLVNLRSLPD